MPLKVNIGLAKKLGQPNYGSTGASCSLEFELDSGQILQDPGGFHRHLRTAYDACRQAIQDELHRQLNPPELREGKVAEKEEPQIVDQEQGSSVPESATATASDPAGTTPAVTTPAVTTPAVTTPAVTTPAVTTPAVTTPAVTTPAVTTSATTTPATRGLVQTSPRASQRQLNYVHHLAHGISGLTPHRLEILSATICGKRLAHLTSADASLLIETLKDIQAGDKDLCGAPQEVCA